MMRRLRDFQKIFTFLSVPDLFQELKYRTTTKNNFISIKNICQNTIHTVIFNFLNLEELIDEWSDKKVWHMNGDGLCRKV